MRKQTSEFKSGPKTSTDISPKNIYTWLTHIWKDGQHHMSLGKCKLKQGDTITIITMAKIQNTNNTKRWQGYGAIGTLILCWWECKMGWSLCKALWQFLTKLNIALHSLTKLNLYDPAAVLQVFNELKTTAHTKTCMQVFIAVLFIIAKIWKQPRCPLLVSGQIEVHPYNGILFS